MESGTFRIVATYDFEDYDRLVAEGRTVTGTLYAVVDNVPFPGEGWVDFTGSQLPHWAHEVLTMLEGAPSVRDLRFMNAPLALRVHTQPPSDQVLVEAIHKGAVIHRESLTALRLCEALRSALAAIAETLHGRGKDSSQIDQTIWWLDKAMEGMG